MKEKLSEEPGPKIHSVVCEHPWSISHEVSSKPPTPGLLQPKSKDLAQELDFKVHSDWFGGMLVYCFSKSRTPRLIECLVRVNLSQFTKSDYKQRRMLLLLLSFMFKKMSFSFFAQVLCNWASEFISLLWSCICSFHENWLETTFP